MKLRVMYPISYLIAGLVGHAYHLLAHRLHVAHWHGGPRRHGHTAVVHAAVGRGHRHHAGGRTVAHLRMEEEYDFSGMIESENSISEACIIILKLRMPIPCWDQVA